MGNPSGKAGLLPEGPPAQASFSYAPTHEDAPGNVLVENEVRAIKIKKLLVAHLLHNTFF